LRSMKAIESGCTCSSSRRLRLGAFEDEEHPVIGPKTEPVHEAGRALLWRRGDLGDGLVTGHGQRRGGQLGGQRRAAREGPAMNSTRAIVMTAIRFMVSRLELLPRAR